MAKKRSPANQMLPVKREQLPEYGELVSIMQNETASIVTDHIRQYVGVIQGRGFNVVGSPAIYLNQDRVQRYQTYQELAFYDLYAEVERDPHVAAILQSAKLNVAGMKWDIEAHLEKGEEEPSKRNQEIADFVKHALKNVGFFPQHLYNLMNALGMGFSVSEVIWDITDDGVVIKDILNRPQRRFQFDAVDRTLRVRTMEAPYYGDPLPDKKFIVHRCSTTWENPFGDALDQSLYWMWLFKKTVLKFWMQHLQVGASSIPIVKHPTGANKELKDEALEIAKMIRNGAYGRIPANFEVLWAEAKNAGLNAEAYSAFVRMCNDEMSKCVNGQTLTAEASSGTGTGSRALGQVHQATQSSRDIFRAEGLSATLNQTVVKWLVDFNFSSITGYPQFRFDLEEAEDLKSEALIVKTLSDAGFEFDEVELSEKFNYQLTKKKALNLKPNPLEKKPDGINPFEKKPEEPELDENGNPIDKLKLEEENATV
jgi:phage gp29-like protein